MSRFAVCKNVQVRALRVLIPVSILLWGAIACASPSVRKGVTTADGTNPFPRELLGHRLFLVFRSAGQNLLGYTLRPGLEKAQVLGAKFWQGKEKTNRGKGEDRTIVFERGLTRRVGAALPGIGFNKSYRGEVSFKMILKGLRVNQLALPVMNEEYRDLAEARTTPFVVSVLSADQVHIQAWVKESSGTRIASRSDIARVFSGDVRWSEKAKGVIAARNRIIGFVAAAPRTPDLERRATDSGLRRLGVFDLKDNTGRPEFAFLATTMRHKLEEAFQTIPDFHVVVKGREDAKYHLKGSYTKIGSRIQFELSLRNTYNQKLEHKLTRVVKADDIDALYDYQITVVREFARNFGLKLADREKQRLKSVVRQTKDLDLLKAYRLARIAYFDEGNQKKCLKLIRPVTARDKEYLDAWLLDAACTQRLSRSRRAEPIVNHALALARKANNPAALARALLVRSWLDNSQNKRPRGLRRRMEALDVIRKAYGDSHPLTADYRIAVAWGRMLLSRQADTKKEYREMLELAEKECLRALNILKRRFGPDHKRLIPAYGALGNMQMKLKKINAAIVNAQFALRLARRYSGENNADTAGRMNDLGNYYRKVKRWDEALSLYNEAERVYQKTMGDSMNLSRAINKNSVGILHYYRRRYDKALQSFLENLKNYKKLFGHIKNHLYIRSAQRKVALAYLKLNDIRNSIKYYRKANLLIYNKIVIARHLRGTLWVQGENGAVPEGAFSIGPDFNGKPLYACRVEESGQVFFGKIRPVYGACNYARGGREARARKYAVLVLKSRPRWLKAKPGVLPDAARILDAGLARKKPARAGDAKKPKSKGPKKMDFLYLCRVRRNGSTNVGTLRRPEASACRFGYGGVSYSSGDYQVLGPAAK